MYIYIYIYTYIHIHTYTCIHAYMCSYHYKAKRQKPPPGYLKPFLASLHSIISIH